MLPAPADACGTRRTPLFLLLQHPERLAGEIRTVDVLGVEDVAQLVTREAVEPGVVGVELGAEEGAASSSHFAGGRARGKLAAGPVGRIPG